MHYLAHNITKLCRRKQRYEGWEGIPMFDCSRKEGVFIGILKCGYLSVCQKVDVSGLWIFVYMFRLYMATLNRLLGQETFNTLIVFLNVVKPIRQLFSF